MRPDPAQARLSTPPPPAHPGPRRSATVRLCPPEYLITEESGVGRRGSSWEKSLLISCDSFILHSEATSIKIDEPCHLFYTKIDIYN